MKRLLIALALVASTDPLSFGADDDHTLKSVTERIRDKAFPGSKIHVVGEANYVDYFPTLMISVPDDGKREKRISGPDSKLTPAEKQKRALEEKAKIARMSPKQLDKQRDKKFKETMSRFFDAVTTLNWENRIYVTELPDDKAAEMFVMSKDGTGDIRSFRLGLYAVWGDKKLIEKSNKTIVESFP